MLEPASVDNTDRNWPEQQLAADGPVYRTKPILSDASVVTPPQIGWEMSSTWRWIFSSGYSKIYLRWMAEFRNSSTERNVTKRRRKLTSAEKRAKRERKEKYMTVFVNGKQKRVPRPRPELIDGLPVDEFVARNADPIWLHQNGLWEYLIPDEEE